MAESVLKVGVMRVGEHTWANSATGSLSGKGEAVIQPSVDITTKRPARCGPALSWRTALRSPLWLCLFAGALIRIWLTIRTHGTLDGDEALLGIQAEHILGGERPLYFYGLSYFGSLEAYVVAAVSAVFGPSVAVLRAVTTAFGLALVGVTWWFAGLLADAARLPLLARTRFMLCAALAAAIPPVYDGIIELRTGGGWIESFVVMLLVLTLAFRLTSRWHAGARSAEVALHWAGIGFLVGLGMWIYPLVSVAILAAALWIVGDSLLTAIRRIQAGLGLRGRSGHPSRNLCWRWSRYPPARWVSPRASSGAHPISGRTSPTFFHSAVAGTWLAC